MQTQTYMFHSIRGFERFAYYCYHYDMINKEAKRRYKIVMFYKEYGVTAALEAFDISKRSLYRYKSILEKNNNKIEALEPKSKTPKRKQQSKVPKEMVDKIKRVREKYFIY